MKKLSVKFRDNTINMSLPEYGVLSAIVCVVDRKEKMPDEVEQIRLKLGGLDSVDGRHPDWGNFDLVAGDSVEITVHDDQLFDEPLKRTGTSREEIAEKQKNYVRKMAAEFGWTIDESPSAG